LHKYANALRQQGFMVDEKLGFGKSTEEIPRIVNEINADLLVIAQHGHRALKDIIFGETIAKVRHNVKCRLLIV
jgi:manganese transport protein